MSRWLAERGLDADALEAEVHRLSGHQPGPLPFDHWTTTCPPRWNPVHAADPRPHGGSQSSRTAISWRAWRILDAAANRAGEGLRVIEDYLRFALDDRI